MTGAEGLAPLAPADGLPSLRRGFSWLITGNVAYAACQWSMLVVLAKAGTTIMVGQFALGLALTAPVVMFTNLQLRATLATDARREYRFADYVHLRVASSLAALAAIAVLVVAGGYRGEIALVVLGVGAAKAIESISDIFYGRLQLDERADRIGRSLAFRGVASVAAFFAGIYFTGRLLWGVVGLIVAWALVLLVHDIRLPAGTENASPWRSKVELTPARHLAALALPLGAVMLIISLNANVPRYVIERQLGAEALGIFAAIAYLASAGGLVMDAVGQAVIPRLARYFAAGQVRAFYGLVGRVSAIGVLVGASGIVVAWAAGAELLAAVYRPEHAARADVLMWLLCAAAISYVVSALGYALIAARLFRVQPALLAGALVWTVAACYYLIPEFGLVGAAWATAMSFVIQLVGCLACLVWLHRKMTAADLGSEPRPGAAVRPHDCLAGPASR